MKSGTELGQNTGSADSKGHATVLKTEESAADTDKQIMKQLEETAKSVAESVFAVTDENEEKNSDEYEVSDSESFIDSTYEEHEGAVYFWKEGAQYSLPTPRRRYGDAMAFALRSKMPQPIQFWSSHELDKNENNSIFRLLVGSSRFSAFVQNWYKSSCAVIRRTPWGEDQIIGTGSLIELTTIVTARHIFQRFPTDPLLVRFFNYEVLPINEYGEYPIKEFYIDVPVVQKEIIDNGLDAGYLQIPLLPAEIFQKYMKVLPIQLDDSRLQPGHYIAFHFAGGRYHQVSIGSIPLTPSGRPGYIHNDIDIPAGNGASGAVVMSTDLSMRSALGHGLSIYRLQPSGYGEPSRRLIPFSKFLRSELSELDKRTIARYSDDPHFQAPSEFSDGSGYEWYSGIVSINKSLLIKAVLQRETGDAKKYHAKGVPEVSFEILKKDFDELIELIEQEDDIALTKSDSFFTSPNGYFRVDVSPSNGWKIDIQDNTGKNKGGPIKCGSKSLSSVFARVILSKGKSSIKSHELAQLLRTSQEDEVAKDLSSLEAPKKSKTPFLDKRKGKSDKNKQKYLESLEETKSPVDPFSDDLEDEETTFSFDAKTKAVEIEEIKETLKPKIKEKGTSKPEEKKEHKQAAGSLDQAIKKEESKRDKILSDTALRSQLASGASDVDAQIAQSLALDEIARLFSSLHASSSFEEKTKQKDKERKTVSSTASSSGSHLSINAEDILKLKKIITVLKKQWNTAGAHITTRIAVVDGERKQFSEYKVRGDGHCGFTTLGISRRSAVTALMELKENPAKRELIIKELIEAYALFDSAKEEEHDPTEYMHPTARARFISYYNQLITARNTGSNPIVILRRLIEDREIFVNYVQSYDQGHNQGLWLGVESMRCIAERRGIGLTILGERTDSEELHPLPSSIPPTVVGGPCVYVILRGGHYNFLVDEGPVLALAESKKDALPASVRAPAIPRATTSSCTSTVRPSSTTLSDPKDVAKMSAISRNPGLGLHACISQTEVKRKTASPIPSKRMYQPI